MPTQVTTVRKTAQRLGLAEVTVRRMIATKQIAVVRVGPRGWSVRVPEEEVERLIKAGMVPAGAG